MLLTEKLKSMLKKSFDLNQVSLKSLEEITDVKLFVDEYNRMLNLLMKNRKKDSNPDAYMLNDPIDSKILGLANVARLKIRKNSIWIGVETQNKSNGQISFDEKGLPSLNFAIQNGVELRLDKDRRIIAASQRTNN